MIVRSSLTLMAGAACLALAGCAAPLPEPDHADLAYAKLSPAQTLDIYLPEGDGPFPLVINIHGGAFRMGDKDMLDAPIAEALRAKGIAVASINYRLSGEAKFPAAIEDAKAAVRFLRANARQYRLDADRFLVFGQSAGGNLASLIGTTGNAGVFDNPALGNPGVPSNVAAVIDWFGPSDFSLLDKHAREQGCPPDHGAADSPESAYLGAAIGTLPDKVQASNPVTYVDPQDPPFLLQKGAEDCLVPVGQSRVLEEALRKAGVAAQLEVLGGAGHGDMGLWQPVFLSKANVARVVAFAEQHLQLRNGRWSQTNGS